VLGLGLGMGMGLGLDVGLMGLGTEERRSGPLVESTSQDGQDFGCGGVCVGIVLRPGRDEGKGQGIGCQHRHAVLVRGV
jgi:hypothetical protein